MKTINLALYGINGHQVHNEIARYPGLRLVAISEFPRERLPEPLVGDSGIKEYATYEELLADPEVDLIALCSPERSLQAAHALEALRAGKHVYAEKPCALSEEDLDSLIRTSRETGKLFHEMANTAFQQPYWGMRKIVQAGTIGEVVQILAEKSYPYYEGRPQDEAIDGGLIGQNGIHALRFVEHVADVRVKSVQAAETMLGNPVEGGYLRMASSILAELENGGIASLSANYLNPRGTGVWGYETLRILGTKGMVESTRGGTHTLLVVGETDHGELDVSDPGIDFLGAFLSEIRSEGTMPIDLEHELLPTRWTIRAKKSLN